MIVKRILILGSGGSGKTSLSRKLAAKTQIPLIHLDALYWKPGWKEPDKTEWQNRVMDLVAQDSWVIEGNYSGTLNLRLPPAEWIILLDIPNWRCIWNIFKRRIKYAQSGSKARPEMPPWCPETISLSFLIWVWLFPRHSKPKVLKAIEQWKNPGARVFIFRNYEAMDRFLIDIPELENVENLDLSQS